MKSFLVTIIPLLILAFLGCHEGFSTMQSQVSLRSFSLFDVGGLRGGDALWVNGAGSAILQVIRKRPSEGISQLWEKRYQFQLAKEQQKEVERLVTAHHVLTIKTNKRDGMPDERKAIIVLVPKAGGTVKVAKWANDKHPDFDALYDYLLRLCRPPRDLKPIYEGAYDQNWRPEGFDRPW